MDWKILVGILVFIVGFFIFQQCKGDDVKKNDTPQTTGQQETKPEKKAAPVTTKLAQTEKLAEKTATLETNEFKAVLTTKNASLDSFLLKNKQYVEPSRDWKASTVVDGLSLPVRNEDELAPVNMVTTNTDDYDLFNPLRFKFMQKGVDTLPNGADFELIETTDDQVQFRYSHPDLPVQINKKFNVDKDQPYVLWLTIRVENTSQSSVSFNGSVSQFGYQDKSETAGGWLSKQPNLLRGICLADESLHAQNWNEFEKPYDGIGTIGFVGVDTNYFISAMLPEDGVPATCHVNVAFTNRSGYANLEAGEQPWGVVSTDLRFNETQLKPGESTTFKIKNYLGPKRYRSLKAIGGNLHESVDFGWFWPISRVLLAMLFFFQSFAINWGLSIILLTVTVKVVLMPLTHRSFKSAERMKALKPEVDKLNEKHKDDAAAKQQATMALYKQHKINPLGGCLPTLLQMPIWIALFRTLRASPELYNAPFFGWITDLSSPDPYFVTPIVMGAFMFLQQRFTPMTGDSAQAKMMMYFMPVMFTAMMLFLPSGLTLYILVNTVLSIAHQAYIHTKSAKAKAGAVLPAKDKKSKDKKKKKKEKK